MHRPAQRDHYATLGLRRSSSAQEIKRAYRDLAKQCHPDIDPSPLASTRFMAVHAAYATLSDPMLRIAYDAQLAERDRKNIPKPPVRKAGETPRYRQRDTDANLPDIRVGSWPFVGLHLTGLLFGLALVSTILAGIIFRHWSWAWIVFITPGLIVIPDAWAGLVMVVRRKRGAQA
jgi:curved DNA-binding protein CbpA